MSAEGLFKGIQQAIDTLKKKYAQQIDQIQAEKKTEIESMKLKVTEWANRANQKVLHQMEDKIAKIKSQYASSAKQAKPDN